MSRHLSPSLVIMLVSSSLLLGQERIDYLSQVKPLLAKKCFRCHGALKQESGLRLDTAEMIARGGESGPAMKPTSSNTSLLIQAITGSGGRQMPPEGKPLTKNEISLLSRWIDQGAQAPDVDQPHDPRDHWSFRPIIRPVVPKIKNTTRLRNPVDAFIAEEHQARKLSPQPQASREILLRRVYFDLIGLPPTPAQRRAFLEDDSPTAYESVVNQLLDSQQYGERWGRHWMDVWRYSDWAGWNQQVRDSQPHIWRWRDWIIESLNQDKSYDRMVLEMLAADELTPTDRNALRATGFLARNFKLLSREKWMQDTIEHTSKALLGLTMACARCHDHMYDPILQEDYYSLRAVFEPHQVRIDRIPGQLDINLNGLPRVYDADLSAKTFFFTRGDDRLPDKDRPMIPSLPKLFEGSEFTIKPVDLAPEAFYSDLRPFVHDDLLKQADDLIAGANQKLLQSQTAGKDITRAEKALHTAETARTALLARIAAEKSRYKSNDSAKTKRLAQAASLAEKRAALAKAEENLQQAEHALSQLVNSDKKDEKKIAAAQKKKKELSDHVAKAQENLKKTDEKYTPLGKPAPKQSSGRRLALARWIVNPQNPLTARVAVNHIWLRHFSQALVPTVFDFGHNGQKPSHPQLLDWLASEFVQPSHVLFGEKERARPWSMKHIHRLLVTSNTYRTASGFDKNNAKLDPDNIYLWQMPTRRLEAEIVRDSVLYVAGELDQTLGGPEVDHKQGMKVHRRSLYFRHAPEKQMTFLTLFDVAAPSQCYQRRDSVMPQQALALANSSLSLVQARRLAAKINEAKQLENEPFIRSAFEHVLSRNPQPAEITACREFLEERQTYYAAHPEKLAAAAKKVAEAERPSVDPKIRARENLVHVLMNHTDFVTIR